MKACFPSSLALRISVGLALFASLAVVAVNFFVLRERIDGLRAELAAQTTSAQKAEGDLARSQNELSKTMVTLKVTATERDQNVADKQAALATAAEQSRLARKLGVELAATRHELQDTQQYLARYRAAGMEPEQIGFAANRISGLERDLLVAQEKCAALEQKTHTLFAALDEDALDQKPVALPAGLTGRVISTDPKWRFVVLDVGTSQGALQNGELLVRRGGKLIGKARISRVQKNRCVANVMTGWDFAEIREGDVAIPATPRT